MSGNGQGPPPEVRAAIQILWLPDGQVVVNHPTDEVVCRFLMDKARVVLDDGWRRAAATAPRVVGAPASALGQLPKPPVA